MMKNVQRNRPRRPRWRLITECTLVHFIFNHFSEGSKEWVGLGVVCLNPFNLKVRASHIFSSTVSKVFFSGLFVAFHA